MNDLRKEHNENEYDSICVNSDFVSNDIDESESQDEKQYAQRI
jgi:hypothetical protein